ncbi:TPA: hypothetical protein ACQGUJ_006379, partial [Pseudomonas aeruginosa]
SMLHLPIFTVSNESSDDLYVLKIDKLLGFKNIEFNFPKLSIKSDFMIFSYVLKLFYSNCDSGKNIFEIDFDMNDFFDFYNVKRNNRSSYTKTMTESIKRLSKINLSFERNDKTYICNFISSAAIDHKNERKFQITLGKNFLNFFEHDPDLIFNINIENLMKLEKDFSKILYLYYVTNLHKLSKENVASFEKEEIFTRLQSLSVDKRKLQMIREANDELIKNGFIKGYSFSKSGNRVTKINVEYFSKKKETIEEDKSSRPKLFN